MNSDRGLRPYFSDCRPPNVGQFDRNGRGRFSKYSYYNKSRTQRIPYNKRNDYAYVPNFQPNYFRTKSLAHDQLKKSSTPTEDQEEEERKRKLSDTANKLLNKIKTWNAENNLNQESNQSSASCGDLNSNSVEQVSNECSTSGKSNRRDGSVADSEGKIKRIAHSKTKNNVLCVKKTVPKPNQPCKNLVRARKYDVNKATVKDFQNRIQHKLINEIMQMPKESLQNVLNDPKINPIMELKMSHLVRENKLLIAQKLRALAESKMTSIDSSSNSQLLFDIDKLIDPVIETDLSVLPYELIKQMENIFQVEFDYSNTRNSCEAEQQSTEVDSNSLNALNSCIQCNDTDQIAEESDCKNVIKLENNDSNINVAAEVSLESILLHENLGLEGSSGINSILTNSESGNQISKTNTLEKNKETESLCNECTSEDFRVYECSTDEDDILEPSSPISIRNKQKESDFGAGGLNKCYGKTQNMTFGKSKRKSTLECGSVYKRRKKNTEPKSIRNRDTGTVTEITENHKIIEDRLTAHSIVPNSQRSVDAGSGHDSNRNVRENGEQHSTLSPSREKFVSTGCQTLIDVKNVEVQTSGADEPATLYGVPLPKCHSNGNSVSLLEEVNSIQNLVNKLNERRFMIFLELARSNPSCSFINNKITSDNFTETLSNGNVDLLESLKEFFTEAHKKRDNHFQTFNNTFKTYKPWKKKRKKRNDKGNGG